MIVEQFLVGGVGFDSEPLVAEPQIHRRLQQRSDRRLLVDRQSDRADSRVTLTDQVTSRRLARLIDVRDVRQQASQQRRRADVIFRRDLLLSHDHQVVPAVRIRIQLASRVGDDQQAFHRRHLCQLGGSQTFEVINLSLRRTPIEVNISDERVDPLLRGRRQLLHFIWLSSHAVDDVEPLRCVPVRRLEALLLLLRQRIASDSLNAVDVSLFEIRLSCPLRELRVVRRVGLQHLIRERDLFIGCLQRRVEPRRTR